MSDPLPRFGMTREFPWLRLKRLTGLRPTTPTADQEGQMRYARDGDVTGTLAVARYITGGTYAWAPVGVLIKAGAPSDSDFLTTPPDGTLALDSTNHRLYIRDGAAWKYATLT